MFHFDIFNVKTFSIDWKQFLFWKFKDAEIQTENH